MMMMKKKKNRKRKKLHASRWTNTALMLHDLIVAAQEKAL
jgi:hypothetical protein